MPRHIHREALGDAVKVGNAVYGIVPVTSPHIAPVHEKMAFHACIKAYF